jgi:PKD repeat protein
MVNGIPLHTNMMYDWDYVTITVAAPGAPLDANADGGNLGGYETIVGEDIQLYGSASGGEPPYAYSWDLGNDMTSNNQNPTAIYETPGIYTVTLTVKDQRGTGDTATDTAEVIVLSKEGMSVSIDVPTHGVSDSPVHMYSQVIGGIAPYDYIWNFGNGDESTDENPIYTYEQTGTFTVTLTVIDSIGTTINKETTINVVEEDTDEMEIGEISGGLGIRTTIKAGSNPVTWSIDIEGLVILGGHASGTIQPGITETVRTPFTFGLGNVEITVTANGVTKQANALMLGPFVLVK